MHNRIEILFKRAPSGAEELKQGSALRMLTLSFMSPVAGVIDVFISPITGLDILAEALTLG